MVTVTAVERGSRAEQAGIKQGDKLISISGNAISDVLDYRFYLADTLIMLECERNGVRFEATIRKSEYDDIGLSFETPLMDKKHSCRNGCVFCFIDQLPKGLRPSLYFKDDDSRLSFLHGNYITLTNLSDSDIDRIIKMHISPINISVHTTNPTLRVSMMRNKRAGEVLSYLDRLAKANIRISAQIVLCKGLNDKKELDRTMRDLLAYIPALVGVSVVPSGLTKFREGLYPLEAFTPEDCREVIRQVNAFGDECREKYGTRIFYLADEFYVDGKLPIPEADYYEDYPQIEDGVGMLRSLEDEFRDELDYLAGCGEEAFPKSPRTVTLVTGAAAYEHIGKLAGLMESRIPNLRIHVKCIVNHFFGESITVAGLLTGKDISEQLTPADLTDELILPPNTLRAEGDLFLCGMTPRELSEKLGNIPITFAGRTGAELVAAILGKPIE